MSRLVCWLRGPGVEATSSLDTVVVVVQTMLDGSVSRHEIPSYATWRSSSMSDLGLTVCRSQPTKVRIA